MINVVLASVALLSARALAGAGSAIVINKCSYDVSLENTPSSGGGYNTIPAKLAAGGGSYSQQYTSLSNNNGWSLKLSKPSNPSDLLQYEYTYHNDGTIWYDLSEVNGNPWDGNWEITATSGCSPRQAAYRYATDDAYGMQSCADSASITVTLCSGSTSGGSQAPVPSSSPQETSWAAPTSAAPSSAAPTSEAPTSQAPTSEAPTSEAPTSEAPAPTQTHGHGHGHGHGHEHQSWQVFGNKVAAPASDATTLVTSSVAWDGPAVTVTNVAYETVTQIVTAVHGHHQHHRRHAHHGHN